MTVAKLRLAELNALNAEYIALVGEPVYRYPFSPENRENPAQWRYAFQGDPAITLGIDEALANMRDKLAQAKAGIVWNGQTIEEFKAERAAMEAAHRRL